MQMKIFTGHNGQSTVWKHETYRGVTDMIFTSWKRLDWIREIWIADTHCGEGIYYDQATGSRFEGTPIMAAAGYMLAENKGNGVKQYVRFLFNDLAYGKAEMSKTLVANEMAGIASSRYDIEATQLEANDRIEILYREMVRPEHRGVNALLVIDPNGPSAVDMGLVQTMVKDRRLNGRVHYVIHLSSNAINRIKALYASPRNSHRANIIWIDEMDNLYDLIMPFFDLRNGWMSKPGQPNGNDFFMLSSFSRWAPRGGWFAKNMELVRNAADARRLIDNYRKSAI